MLVVYCPLIIGICLKHKFLTKFSSFIVIIYCIMLSVWIMIDQFSQNWQNDKPKPMNPTRPECYFELKIFVYILVLEVMSLAVKPILCYYLYKFTKKIAKIAKIGKFLKRREGKKIKRNSML